ncbi:ATP adenylyltransferase-domain-containing protein [Hysterangium stoloniferum]|nr:ATP adenylyltransferase-domain-containing protein [Hysterangium stoloniferum]
MGAFLWHEWAHFVTITSSVYTIWAGFWGLVYRKFFWDFVNGTLRNPGGLQPANSDKIFVHIIVLLPIIQILAMITGFIILALELPLPALKTTSIYRSWAIRIVLLGLQTFLTILFYQIILKVPVAFDEALTSEDLLLFHSDVNKHEESNVQFELRLCPALQKKPQSHSAVISQGHIDPFAPPYNPKLLVGELDVEGEDYIVLLNKYSVVRGHFLLVTKEYQSQNSPLLPPDLLQAYLLLVASYQAGKNHMAFYNCGELSGASQPHKHLQFIPVDNEGPPIERLIKSQIVEATDEPFTISSLPYSHGVFRLPTSLRSSSSEAIMKQLSEAFLALLDLVLVAMRHNPTQKPGPPSYNVLLTLDHMHVIPRSKEKHILSKTGEVVNINALAYAGMLLTKSDIELQAVKDEGVMKILSEVGIKKHDEEVDLD